MDGTRTRRRTRFSRGPTLSFVWFFRFCQWLTISRRMLAYRRVQYPTNSMLSAVMFVSPLFQVQVEVVLMCPAALMSSSSLRILGVKLQLTATLVGGPSINCVSPHSAYQMNKERKTFIHWQVPAGTLLNFQNYSNSLCQLYLLKRAL
jgi:hypothetical protein